MKVFTIGFTQKHAEEFYEKINKANIDLLIDVRLNNTSQLASFSKFPDIVYFLDKLCSSKYCHDEKLAPTDALLKGYKKGDVTWSEYENVFAKIMEERKINNHIQNKYSNYKDLNVCLLCSEPTPEKCHRRLVAEYFKDVFDAEIIHI